MASSTSFPVQAPAAPARAPVREFRRLRALTLGAILVALAATVAALTWQSYRQIRADATERTAHVQELSSVLAAHALRTFGEVDRELRLVEAGIRLAGGLNTPATTLHETLRQSARRSEPVRSLLLLDTAGQSIADADALPPRPFNGADRAYFRVHADNPASRLFVAPPVQSRLNGLWAISTSRALRDAQGDLQGVVVAAVDPAYFDWLTRELRLRPTDRVVILGRDGFVRYAAGAPLIGTRQAEAAAALDGGNGPLVQNRLFDGMPRAWAAHALGDLPLALMVGITLPSADAVRHDAVAAALPVALPPMAAMLFIAALLFREFRRASGNLRTVLDAEAQARDMAASLQGVIETIPDIVITVDTEGRTLLTNEAGRRLLGLRNGDGDAPGIAWRLDGTGQPMAPDRHPSRRVARGEAFDGEEMVVHLHDATEPMTLSVTGRPLHAADGVRLGGIIVARDMTAQRRTETHLNHARKMEAIGQLTGGVAHDFNNILTVILGGADAMLANPALSATDRKTADLVLRAAERGGDLTRSLLAFARQQPLLPRAVDVNALLAATRPLIARAVDGRIALDFDGPADLWLCSVDPGQLEVALLNLAVNCRDAMPDGGQLTITTSNCALAADARPGIAAGDYVCIAITDTGQGMTPGVLAQAVDPFFTTKEPGKGTGLGLSMVHGFTIQSGGTLHLDSAPGQGTTARIYLPRHAGAPASQTNSTPALVPTGQAERVLAVEDEPMLREQVGRQLRGLGYAVTVAATGREALALVEGGLAVDLLFTDIIMPGGLNGLDLASAVTRLRPGSRILFTSGYPGGENGGDGSLQLPPGARLLAKPYRLADLAEALRAALA